jgi:hypothetical protein
VDCELRSSANTMIVNVVPLDEQGILALDEREWTARVCRAIEGENRFLPVKQARFQPDLNTFGRIVVLCTCMECTSSQNAAMTAKLNSILFLYPFN